jgi:hypothetical protein
MVEKIMYAIKTTLVIENKQSVDLLKSKITKILNEEVRKDSVKVCISCKMPMSQDEQESSDCCLKCMSNQ